MLAPRKFRFPEAPAQPPPYLGCGGGVGGLERTPRAASYLARVPPRSPGHPNSCAVGLRRVLLHPHPALPASAPSSQPILWPHTGDRPWKRCCQVDSSGAATRAPEDRGGGTRGAGSLLQERRGNLGAWGRLRPSSHLTLCLLIPD